MAPPSLLSRVLGTISIHPLFQLLALLFLLSWICGDTQLFAEPAEPRGAILGRSQRDLLILTEMDASPQVASPPAPQVRIPKIHKPKTPEKYDVTRIGERRVGSGLNMYSIEQEQAIGRRLAEELESRCRIVRDPVVTRYIEDLGQRLVRNSDAKIQFTIKVVDSDEINAYALPGGYFYVNTGLILAAQDEAELASVMAHEIAHVAARHATRNMTKIQLWNIASIPLVFFGGPIGMALRQASSIAFPMSVTKFSRDAEREADLLGIEYEYAAGYDPAAFVDFFERLKLRETKKNLMAKAFASHPMNRDRIERAQKEIDTMLPPRDEYIVDTSQFEEVHLRLLQLMNPMPVLNRRQHREGGPVLRRRTTETVPQNPGESRLPRN
jgi:beta-barrel assembly-enhancing protease